MIWLIKYLLRGYRVVDSGAETTAAMAAERAMDTLRRYGRSRSSAVKITDKTWVVMVKGWDPKKEDG